MMRKVIEDFGIWMEAVLRRNDHKPDWVELMPWEIMDLMRQEVKEVLDEVNLFDMKESDVVRQAIRYEAADVAICAMMLWDLCREIPSRNRGHD